MLPQQLMGISRITKISKWNKTKTSENDIKMKHELNKN